MGTWTAFIRNETLLVRQTITRVISATAPAMPRQASVHVCVHVTARGDDEASETICVFDSLRVKAEMSCVRGWCVFNLMCDQESWGRLPDRTGAPQNFVFSSYPTSCCSDNLLLLFVWKTALWLNEALQSWIVIVVVTGDVQDIIQAFCQFTRKRRLNIWFYFNESLKEQKEDQSQTKGYPDVMSSNRSSKN